MSKYKTDNYIQSCLNNIMKQSNEGYTYNLGVAQGLLIFYKYIKDEYGIETATQMFKSHLNTKEEYSKILLTLIGLDNEPSTEIERKIQVYKDIKLQSKNDEALTEEEINILARIMRIEYSKFL